MSIGFGICQGTVTKLKNYKSVLKIQYIETPKYFNQIL